MARVFVVMRSRGPAWDDSKPLEEQVGWAAHAAFMDALFDHRFAALVGPLEGTRDALLILRAASASEIVERLASDPWTIDGHLVTTQISPWQLRLGSLRSLDFDLVAEVNIVAARRDVPIMLGLRKPQSARTRHSLGGNQPVNRLVSDAAQPAAAANERQKECGMLSVEC
jgi:hypothetical protein